MVHLSGFLFVILAQFIGQLIVVYFFAVALTLLLYSQIILKEFEHANIFARIESRVRDFTMKFERDRVPRPFTGAIWFFVSMGITFLVFPLPVASAAGLMLSIGDSLSTLIGKRFGKTKILGRKTAEGTLSMFAGSLAAIWFFPVIPVLLAAAAATAAELAPESRFLRRFSERGLIDDNILVPLVGGVILVIAIGSGL